MGPENRQSILLHEADNVATALTDLQCGATVHVSLVDITYLVVLGEDIAFAHKFAVTAIAKGDEIRKFGLPIGRALTDIQPGESVHVHNCRSDRFGFHREQYGLYA